MAVNNQADALIRTSTVCSWVTFFVEFNKACSIPTFSPSLSLHYSSVNPLKIVYGKGAYLYDENDQPYLDCINNVTQGTAGHNLVV